MFSFIFRTITKSDSIKKLITDIKFILAQETPNDLINSYETRKIDQQKTLQLKILTLSHLENFSIIEDLYLNNSTLKFMLNDLVNNASTLSIVEINDFLAFYRKSLGRGINFLTTEQRLKLFESLKAFEHTMFHQIPIRATTFFNFSLLGIENENLIKVPKRNELQNIKASDMYQIIYAMNLNKAYYNENFLREIESKTQLILGRLSNMKTFSGCLETYLELHEIYNRKPSESVLKCYLNKFSQIQHRNTNAIHLLIMNASSRVLRHLYVFKDELLKHKKNPPHTIEKYIDFCLSYKRFYPDDSESLKNFIKVIKNMVNSCNNLDLIPFFKILKLMDKNSLDPELIWTSLSLVKENNKEFSILNEKLYLIIEAYYSILTKESILNHPLLRPLNMNTESILKGTKLCHISKAISVLSEKENIDHPHCKNLLNSIESYLLTHKQDPFLFDFMLKSIKYESHLSGTPLSPLLFNQLQNH